MQMFLWNNIFFSLGFDVKEHYKDFGGDAAAYVAPVCKTDIENNQTKPDLGYYWQFWWSCWCSLSITVESLLRGHCYDRQTTALERPHISGGRICNSLYELISEATYIEKTYIYIFVAERLVFFFSRQIFCISKIICFAKMCERTFQESYFYKVYLVLNQNWGVWCAYCMKDVAFEFFWLYRKLNSLSCKLRGVLTSGHIFALSCICQLNV